MEAANSYLSLVISAFVVVLVNDYGLGALVISAFVVVVVVVNDYGLGHDNSTKGTKSIHTIANFMC